MVAVNFGKRCPEAELLHKRPKFFGAPVGGVRIKGRVIFWIWVVLRTAECRLGLAVRVVNEPLAPVAGFLHPADQAVSGAGC